MSADNHASYARIGFTVFAGAIAIVLTLIYLGGIGDRGDEFLIETCYDKPVSGLSVGSVVNFRGVKVGEVREIGFIGDKYDVEGPDNSRIYIAMAVSRKQLGIPDANEREFIARIAEITEKLGLRASVVSSGITGLSRIECDVNLGPERPEAPHISWTPHHAYIPSKISLLDNFSVAATKVMNQINSMDLNAAWSNVQTIVETVASMAENVNAMVEARQDDVDRVLDDLSAASASVKDLAAELRENPSLLVRERIPGRLDETR